MINLDEYIINEREKNYKDNRMNNFIKMIKRHKLKKCKCSKNNKNCNISGNINLENLENDDYIVELYNNGILDSLYNIFQSITQSLRSNTGKYFEKIIEDTFKLFGLKENIHYKSQVKLTDGTIVDFLLPAPPTDVKIIDIKNYNGK